MGRTGWTNGETATITRYVLKLLGFILLVVVLYRIQTIVAVTYLSLIVAAAIHPLAVIMQRRMPRAIALILIYLFLGAVLVLLGYLILPPLVVQLGSFLTVLPEQTGEVRAFLESIDFWLAEAGVPINLAAVADQIRGQVVALAVRVLELPVLIYEIGALIFAIAALSFYWLLDRERLINSLVSLFPHRLRGRARVVYLRSEALLGAYTRGVASASIILGIMTYTGLLILGVPFPLLLAIVAAITEVIPIVGPFIAAFPILGIAFSQSFGLGVATLVFWVGIQLLEGNVITPMVQREAVRLPPFTILVAILIGASLLGILGALLAIPTAVLIGVLMYELSPSHDHRDNEDAP